MISLNEVIVGTIDLIVMNKLIFLSERKQPQRGICCCVESEPDSNRVMMIFLLFVVCIQKQLKLIYILGDCWLLYLLLRIFCIWTWCMPYIRPLVLKSTCDAFANHSSRSSTCFRYYKFNMPIFFFFISFLCFSRWLCSVVCKWRYWRFVNSRIWIIS